MMFRIFRHFVSASIVLLALCEISLIFFGWSFYVFDKTYASTSGNIVAHSPALVLALLAVGVMALSGICHNKAFVDFRIMVVQIAIIFAVLCAIVFVWNYFQNSLDGASRSWVFEQKAVLTWLFCILLTRLAFLRLAELDVFKRRVVVLGRGQKAARIALLAKAGSNRYFLPVAYLPCGGDARNGNAEAVDLHRGGPDAIAECARDLGATEIVVAADDRRGLPVTELLRCRAAGIRVIDYLDFIERQTKTVDLDALQPGWLIFSDGFRRSSLANFCKRVFDIASALGLVLFTLPLMLLTALLIVLDSKGPILYRQERVGLGGRSFVLLKFRSMRTDAEKDGAPRWASTRDPRVTRVGAFIRKVRIDELPQLLNVLRGDMSLVGPRPERPGFVDEFTKGIPFYAERHCVKPGITGWAQINYPYGASLEDARYKLSYDLYYIKNHSLFLDLIIVSQTVRVILSADGAR
jgi:sugar transferase (PEP-CTERM system associated)